jgi:hypothetical protein
MVDLGLQELDFCAGRDKEFDLHEKARFSLQTSGSMMPNIHRHLSKAIRFGDFRSNLSD